MRYKISRRDLASTKSGCTVVGVMPDEKLTPSARHLDRASRGAISRILARGDMPGKPGQALWLFDLPGIACERILLIGCGADSDRTLAAFRKIIAGTAKALEGGGARDAVFCLAELSVGRQKPAWRAEQCVIGLEDAWYRSDTLKKTSDKPQFKLESITFHAHGTVKQAQLKKALTQGQAIANGILMARSLGNLPANICTPAYLAKKARELARNHPKLTVSVMGESQMRKHGMGALLSVAQGSHVPAQLITINYQGSRSKRTAVALVGKGVTFDTGGISLKPALAMDEMKFDMCGAASVLGTLQTCAELGLPINITAVIPTTENMPSGSATKPGDIVTSMSGQSIEILNTDAEGRLILCDALTWAQRFKPEVVIDIATLTGACVIALGKYAHGLLSNDDALAEKLLAAGEQADDRAWHMPLWEEYQQQLDSNFADMANIGGREAGTITAACFLSRFTKDVSWAHLDIAGTAWKSGTTKGATGRPVPLLVHYLINRALGT
ncbi:MAG: leucyl aminopeptidase [Gammaproteobacteria bacterium]|nr:MAG: leucyl aminopeptidase [Gammaproteobacteria bacterium]